jgi:hypothetical protein
MPTVEEIERLTAQLARLGPLSEARPGELILAEAWNTVVDVLVEVARALIEEQERPVRPHDHPDQVQLGWLDPRLRQLVEGGPLADPANLARVNSLELTTGRLQAALDELAAQVTELRERGREIATRDIEREAAVSIVRRKVEGIADGRDDVLDVRASLDAVRGRVERAVKLAEDLEAGGEPVDLGALQERVGVLDELRERLELPSGETLDGAAFERRLAELRNELVDEEKLNAALADHRAELDPGQETALEGRLRTSIDERFEADSAALRADVEARTDERLADLDQRVQKALADATPALRDGILADARAQAESQAAEAVEKAGAQLRGEIEAGATVLRAQIDSEVAGVRAEMDDHIDKRIDERLPTRVAPLEEAIASTREDLAALGGRTERAESSIGGLSTRMDRIDSGIAAGLGELRAEFDKRFAEAESSFTKTLGELESRVNRTIDERTAAIEAGIEERLKGELDERDTRLREDAAGIATDQLAGFEDRLPRLVSRQLETSSADAVRKIAERVVEERLGPR